MTTVINTPAGGTTDSLGSVLIGIVVVAVLGVLFFVYALPIIRANNAQTQTPPTIDVNLSVPKDILKTPTPQPTPQPAP
jgi:hypothetical protein